MRQVRINLQAHISVFAISLIVDKPELVSGALHVTQDESLVDIRGVLSLERQGPNVLVVSVATGNRLLEDGWIRCHPAQSVRLDQSAELAAGDQIASDAVQPDGLAERL